MEWYVKGLKVLGTEASGFLERSTVAGNKLESGREEPGLAESGRKEIKGSATDTWESGWEGLEMAATGFGVQGKGVNMKWVEGLEVWGRVLYGLGNSGWRIMGLVALGMRTSGLVAWGNMAAVASNNPFLECQII